MRIIVGNRNLNAFQFIVVLVIILGFIIGTYDHANMILKKGLLSARPEMPIVFNIFWDTLVIGDILVILLLLKNIKIGLDLASIIIVTDVIVNSTSVGIDYYYHRNFVMFGLFTQIPFMIFVLYYRRDFANI